MIIEKTLFLGFTKATTSAQKDEHIKKNFAKVSFLRALQNLGWL